MDIYKKNVVQFKVYLVFLFCFFATNVVAAPSTPQSPSANLNGTTLTLSWNGVSGATYYKIGYRDGNGTWNTSSSTYTGTSKTWTNVTGLNQRSYRLSACDGSGCSGWSGGSNPVTTLSTPTVPNTPVATQSGTTNSLSWNAANNATYYEVFTSYNNGASTGLTQHPSTSASWSNLNAGTRNYRVRACNSSGCSSYSGISNTITTIAVPAPMAAPVATLTTTTNTLSWNAVSHATYYNIRYRDGAGSWNVAGRTYIGTSNTWPNNVAITERSYSMQACNTAGCSTWSAASNAITIVLVPASPNTPTATQSGNTNSITWNAVVNATYYEMFTSYNSGSSTAVTQHTSTSVNSSNLNAGTRNYKVRACNSAGCSNYSSVSNTITTVTSPNIPLPPSPPSGPTTVLANTSFTVSWSTVSGAASYQLSRNSSLVQTSSSTSASQTISTAGTYSYTVKACNSASACSAASSALVVVVSATQNTERSVVFIHTDLLGSPAAETDGQGGLN